MNGDLTYQEILSQPDAWADALRAFAARQADVRQAWAEVKARRVVFIGCGSTHYLSLTAAALFRGLTGVPAEGRPSSELLFFFDEAVTDPEDTLLVCVSRSGTTTETLVAVDHFRRRGGRAVWTVTCYPDSPLAAKSDLVLPCVAAQEQSVAQTRSFTSMLLLCQALAAALGGAEWRVLERLPDLGRALIAATEPWARTFGRRLEDERVYFLGSGPQYGLAAEAMLKMTEMSLTQAQAFHFMEFRHGPMSMVDSSTLICGLLSREATRFELEVLHEMEAREAFIVALNPTGSNLGDTRAIDLPDDLPPWAQVVLYLPPLQLLGTYRARAKGLDPDNPRGLSQVILLDPATLP